MSNLSKFLIAIGTGVSLTISGVLVYLLMFKKEEDYEEISEMEGIQTSRQTIIRIKIPTTNVGEIIGRQGENIKEIQKKTQTRISFEDQESDKQKASEKEFRIAIIRGTQENAIAAETIINELLANIEKVETEVIFLPQRLFGMLIGKNGDNIRYMSRASGAKIAFERGGDERDPDALKKVTIKGTVVQIQNAKGLVDEKIAENEAFRQRLNLSTSGRTFKSQGYTPAIEASNSIDTENTPDGFLQEKLVSHASDGFIEVYISAVESPSRFWLQVVGVKSIELDKLSVRMTEFYSDDSSRETMLLNELHIGDVVASLFSVDDTWYRGRVTNIELDDYKPSDSKITVYFVDFGDTTTSTKDYVCSLKPEFLQLPFQAIECSLNGIKPKADIWNSEATDLFEKITYAFQWKSLMAKPVLVAKKDDVVPIMYVDLVDTNANNDFNIADELVKKDFAIKTKTE